MLDGEQTFWQRKRMAFRIVLFLVILLFVFLTCYQPSTPDGVYYDPDLACGHGCWIFKDGQIYTECEDHVPQAAGKYFKLGNQWVNNSNPTNEIVIKPFLLGIKLESPTLKNGHEFFVRDSFSWVFDCKEWVKKHF
jgi:hypothetical protein